MKKIFFILISSVLLIGACKKDEDIPEENKDTLPDNYVTSIYIDSYGVKYFATKKGLASFDGARWKVMDDNPKIKTGIFYDIDFEKPLSGPRFWLGSNEGVTAAMHPITGSSEAVTFTKSNSQIMFPGQTGLAGDSVYVVQIDKKSLKWFGTNRGISVFAQDKWPEIDLKNYYSGNFFIENEISSIGLSGDTAYVGTKGGGVARLVTGQVDAVTAASPYEIPWSSLASNTVLAVFTDGNIQWYGTEEGLTKHIGTNTKSNWYSYFEEDGLVDNTVQCIQKDLSGNMWFGTKGGVSRFDGTTWTSFTSSDGLVSNNVLSIALDVDGSMWFGTDSGVSQYVNNSWVNFRVNP